VPAVEPATHVGVSTGSASKGLSCAASSGAAESVVSGAIPSATDSEPASCDPPAWPHGPEAPSSLLPHPVAHAAANATTNVRKLVTGEAIHGLDNNSPGGQRAAHRLPDNRSVTEAPKLVSVSAVLSQAGPCHTPASVRSISSRVKGTSLLLVLFACASGCGGHEHKPAPPAFPVQVAKAASQDFPITLSALGSAEAWSTVSIKPQVQGELTEVHFTEGQEVKAGDLLFTIDPRPYRAAVQQARGAFARDEAQLRNAQLQATRLGNLVGPGVVSREQYDQALATERALSATLQADRAGIETAQLQLNYCTLRSPIDGRTGSLLVHKGNLVKPADATALVVINKVHPIFVSFTLPEQNLPEVQRYQAQSALTVTGFSEGQTDNPIPGKVTFLDNQVDRSTGTIRLKAEFPNVDNRLWPGQYVRILVNLTTLAAAVVVPSSAVQRGQSGSYVFVVGTDQEADLRNIRAGAEASGLTVVEQGLQAGEMVVTDGQVRLSAGAHVQVKNRPIAEREP
jgi:membrane fusion protein, multidrug efflux system